LQAIENNNNNNNNDRTKRQTAPVAYVFDSLGSDISKKHYIVKLEHFFEFIGLEGNSIEEKGQTFLAKAKQKINDNDNPYWIEDSIQDFLTHHKERVKKGEIGENTPSDYYWPIKRFCDGHKRNLPGEIDWNRLSNIVPRVTSYSNDRCPTVLEIRKVIKNPNRRVKPIVLVMCSSGIRLASWTYLKWKHVKPITNSEYLRWKKQQEEDEKGHSNIMIPKEDNEDESKKIIAARLWAYDTKRKKWYFSFITAEAYSALKELMDHRHDAEHENIDGESWIIINEKVSFASTPKKLSYAGLKKLLGRVLKEEGVRGDVLPEGQRRYDWKQSHGYRKFFETYAGSVMHPYNVKLLMDHTIDVEDSYWKPTEMEILDEYLKAIPKLTINNYEVDKSVLQKEVAELTEKSEQREKEKEKADEETKKEIAQLRAQQEIMQANYASQFEALMATEVGIKNPKVEIITYRAEDGPEGLLKAAELARAKNQKRQEEYHQRQRDIEEQLKRNQAQRQQQKN
jgi:hypothetical protein